MRNVWAFNGTSFRKVFCLNYKRVRRRRKRRAEGKEGLRRSLEANRLNFDCAGENDSKNNGCISFYMVANLLPGRIVKLILAFNRVKRGRRNLP